MIVRALSRVFILCLVAFGLSCFLRFDGGVQRRRLTEDVAISSAEHKEENTTKSSPSASATEPTVKLQASNKLKSLTVDLVPGEVLANFVGGQSKKEQDDASNVKREKPCKKGTKRTYVVWANGWKCMRDPKYDDTSKAPSSEASKKSKVRAKGSTASGTTANNKVVQQPTTPPPPPPPPPPRQEQNGLLNTLRKFVPLSQEGVCLARHRGGMNGTVVKVDSYSSRVDASSSSELAKDAACCARCARHVKCEFWVRDSSDSSSKCWLMRDFSGFNLHANRRSSFNSAWAEKVRFQLTESFCI